MEGYLVHHGIKGQRWGVIRTPEQLGHAPSGSDEKKNGWLDPTIKQGKDKPNISPAEKVTKEAKNIADNSEKLADAIEKASDKKGDYSEMSDAELQKRINRLRMERELDSLTAGERNKGLHAVQTALSIIGPTVGIAASLATIASVVATIMKKKS